MEKLLIGIQARSTSTRFPGKAHADLCGKPVLQHVIDNCENAAKWLNYATPKSGIETSVMLLIPEGDKIRRNFRRTLCFEGSEPDVLSRYYEAARDVEADFIVRVTGDCPLLYGALISRVAQGILKNNYDYYSNVWPEFRGFPDGLDVEGFTFDALERAHEAATTDHDREHVTTWIRNNCARNPLEDWLDACHLHPQPFMYAIQDKLSVDTEEDLETVRAIYSRWKRDNDLAERALGEKSIHRF